MTTEQLKAVVMDKMHLQMMSTFGIGKIEKIDLVKNSIVAIKGKGKEKVKEDDRKSSTPIDSDDDFMYSQGYTPIKGDISIHEDFLNEDMEISLQDSGNELYNLIYKK